MATFVLVHGGWHGAWCWRDVTPILEKDGHRVLAPDLPGHGDDRAPVGAMTLESYARRVQSTIDSSSEPVVLVGHSMAGKVITQAAEYVPDKIVRLVYLSAGLYGDGQTMADIAAAVDGAEHVHQHLVVDQEAGTYVVSSDAIVDLFYNECSKEDAKFAAARLVPESLAATAAPLRISADRAGRVPRAYIECLRDHAIDIALQRYMYSALPCDPVLSIDSDHSPFISSPAQLSAHLLSLVQVES